MTESRPLVLPRTSESDVEDARIRLVAAAVALPCALALLYGDPGALRISLSLAGVAASIGWAAAARRALRAGSTTLGTLTLRDEALELARGEGVVTVAYRTIVDFDLDDTAADLVLVLDDGSRTTIEPGYGGFDAVALHRLIVERIADAKSCERG